MRPEVASQELDAVFLDTSGASIFPLSLLLMDDGAPHPDDGFDVQYVGVIIDSNSGKGGEGRDGCAALVFAITMPNIMSRSFVGARVVLLDWDIVSLAQGGIVAWLSHVRAMTWAWFQRLSPAMGLPKAHIEMAANGPSFYEAAQAQGFHPNEIDSGFVALGKDNRALRVESHFLAGRVKIGAHALARRTAYRGVTQNHLVSQVTGFKTFDAAAGRREDDLLDCACYATLVSLGDGLEQRWNALKRAA
jgi:hypothetical protein